jgi:hypothetical protein
MTGILNKKNWKITTLLLALSLGASAQQQAFPSAAGFGRHARGGDSIYHVTTLADSGKGSLRDAVSLPGRIVVFDVAGTIHIKDKLVVASRTTIKGDSAPAGGITVYGNGVSFSGSHDVIVRYMRFRGSIDMPRGTCTVIIDNAHEVILDHVSIEWGRWDDLHIKNSRDITLQNCIIGEGIDPQRFGALMEGPVNVTVYRCLWIDNQSRNPKAKAGLAFVNNVIYNWGSNGFVGGHSAADHYQDIIGNYFIAGPSSSDNFMGEFTATDHVYQRGNYLDMDRDGKLNGRLIGNQSFSRIRATILEGPHHPKGIPAKVEKASTAYRRILKDAGASRYRDSVDRSLIRQLRSLGKEGSIIHTEKAGG